MRKLFAMDHKDDGIQLRHWGVSPMPRYVRQRDEFRCGPIVVANALKWAGVDFSWKDGGALLTSRTKCCRHHGAEREDMDAVLRAHDEYFTIRHRRKMGLRAIRREMDVGGAIVIGFDWPKIRFGEEAGHYALLVDRLVDNVGTEYFGLVNLGLMDEGVALEYIRLGDFKRILLRRKKSDEFWMLRKKRKRVGRV